MGRVKAMMMDLEEKFEEKAVMVADDCETWHEFSSKMESHMDLVNHMGLDDVMNMLAEIWTEHQMNLVIENHMGLDDVAKAIRMAEIWTEHQESAGKEAYGGVVLDD